VSLVDEKRQKDMSIAIGLDFESKNIIRLTVQKKVGNTTFLPLVMVHV
jgi:hypothetical protein